MIRLRLTVLAVLVAASAFAQAAELRLGFDGAFVAGRWNPIEFSIRDVANVTLTITIDQGDLRTGSLPARHTWQLPGGPGLSVVEDELFIPAWQSFSWSAATPGRVVASGSFHPRDLDERPLAVIMSSQPSRHASLVPAGTRLVGQSAARLPERLAAWDGVELLLIDGSTAPPTLAAVAAAAAAGANVVLLEPLPASFGELLLLAEQPVTRLGAGQLLRGTTVTVAEQLRPLPDSVALDGYLAELNEFSLSSSVRPIFLFPLLIIYSAAAVLLIRSAGLPGAVAAACLGTLGAVLAWPSLQPEATLSRAELQLQVSAGGLSRSYSSVRLLHRQGGELQLTGHYRPLSSQPYAVTDGESHLLAQRWRPVELAGRPRLQTASQPEELSLTGSEPLLSLFPEGSVAHVSAGRIEVFLPQVSR